MKWDGSGHTIDEPDRSGVYASRTENRSLLHAWIAVAIRHFLTEALKKEEGAAAKKDDAREKEKERGLSGVETAFRAIEHGGPGRYT